MISANMLNDRIDYFVTMGKYFGYPECCIKEFCDVQYAFKRAPEVRAAGAFGFLPCRDCAKKILEGKTTLLGLIKDRICSNPFPVEPSDTEIRLYLDTVEQLLKLSKEDEQQTIQESGPDT